MANNYDDSTGVLVLSRVTPVIAALFGAFNLDGSYPGNGQAYIARMSESNEPTWDDIAEGLDELVGSLNLANPEVFDKSVAARLKVLACHFGAAEDDVVKNLIEQGEFEGEADLGALFDLAQRFDDGHGLSAMSLEGCWHSSRPRLFEFGGTGVYFSRSFRYSVRSSEAGQLGVDIDEALAENDLDTAAARLMKEVDGMLDSVQDDRVRDQLAAKLQSLMTQKLAQYERSTTSDREEAPSALDRERA